ncbi:antitoxin of toxin-antitoxin stability system [Thermotomaculum hydrothermale]|uniref:Antitoxin n=1 Tax=Thermotomaculum hydrothermale TaxID=981385 RepID=A0A7R6SZ33_9BACT|nr:type II toxin-antitoxin system prevent-host-death family antitoxin [Thermotomaculum hydrothermale]BBB33434.1 antitoxin of toxin-antitoxin stability system [Thermotomaculum hydrothermale]
MEKILSPFSVSISELKKSPKKIIENAKKTSVVVLNHNKPCAYILSPEQYENLLEKLEEKTFSEMVKERLKEKDKAVEISIDEL